MKKAEGAHPYFILLTVLFVYLMIGPTFGIWREFKEESVFKHVVFFPNRSSLRLFLDSTDHLKYF